MTAIRSKKLDKPVGVPTGKSQFSGKQSDRVGMTQKASRKAK